MSRGEGPKTPALEIQYPALQLVLDKIAPRKIGTFWTPTGLMECTLALTGELTWQKQGSCNPVSFAQDGYQIEVSKQLGNLLSTFAIGVSGSGVTLGHEIIGKFHSAKIEFKLPHTWVYTLSPQPVSATVRGATVTGKIGFEVTMEELPQQPVAVSTRVYRPVPGLEMSRRPRSAAPHGHGLMGWLAAHKKEILVGAVILAGIALFIVAPVTAPGAVLSFTEGAQALGVAVTFAGALK